MPHLNRVGATSACLHGLPTPPEARASRRRERFGGGRSPFRKGGLRRELSRTLKLPLPSQRLTFHFFSNLSWIFQGFVILMNSWKVQSRVIARSVAVARRSRSKPGDSSRSSEQAPQSHEIKHLQNTRLLRCARNDHFGDFLWDRQY